MASSPVKFFFALLVVSTIGWIIFMFAARLVSWLLSRILGASISFRVAGCNCLRDVNLKFRKGSIESVAVGEMKISLRKSLVKLSFSFISRDPKLQLMICDLEVVMRPSSKGNKKGRTQRSRSSGRGNWVILTTIARFFSVYITDLTIKVPKATVEVKELRLDISKSGSSNPVLNVKLYILPFLINLENSQFSYDQSSSDNQMDCLITEQSCLSMNDKNSSSLNCPELSIHCDFGHDREKGIKLKNLDVTSGDVLITLNEEVFMKANKKVETPPGADVNRGGSLGASVVDKSQKDPPITSIKKNVHVLPDKVSFRMPKLDMKLVHRGLNLLVENNVTGIHLRSIKALSTSDSGETSSHFDVQIDFSEIHLIREGTTSLLEILKVAVVASVDVPMMPLLPIRAEVDVKLGGTQYNLILERIKTLLKLRPSKDKKMLLRAEKSHHEKTQINETKVFMWSCTISAPEMTVVLYNLNGMPIYHGCSQSSHFFANNIASKGIQVHTELGELHLHMSDEYQQCLKENLFGVETNSSSLMYIGRVNLDWGHREVDSRGEHSVSNLKLVLSVDITGMGIHFGFKHVETLVLTIITFETFLKSLSSASGKRGTESKFGRTSKESGKGIQIIKFNLEKCSINYCGDSTLEEMVVPDPKRVNYGSQGGKVIVSMNADGTPRTASITSTLSSNCRSLKFCTSLEIFHFGVCVNKEKESTQVEIERARSLYEEYPFERKPGFKVTLFDMQNAKLVRRSGGLSDIAVCSLFSATDISIRWEPDVHLSLFEFFICLKSLLHQAKSQDFGSGIKIKPESKSIHSKQLDGASDVQQHSQPEKQPKKKESVFAVDVEMLRVTAELGDGVEAIICVQSIFSENAKIGVLLEGLLLSFNNAKVFKSSRMQISRVPVPDDNSVEAKVQNATKWDWVVQSLDIHICMPYRLQLRAIDDAVEDMLRGLKLITATKTSLLFPVKKDDGKKVEVKPTKFGSVRFIIRKITADIEEEPIQGWFDEHYQLIKNEACELGVRLKFLEEILSSSGKHSGSDPSETCPDRKIMYNGVEIGPNDVSRVQSMKEDIHNQAFRSYYQACKKLIISVGSGACAEGWQSRFKPSINRASLFSVCATELDFRLSPIKGGELGMIEFVRKMDPVASENEIPFSRLYGTDTVLNAASLIVRIRNYTFPLLSAASGKCEGRIVLAQQATRFQPQILQDVIIGRWRKVTMMRSATGTTPPMKTYSELPIHFQKGDISFGVGYEPAFADISYAFTVALRRANLSTRGCSDFLANQPPKKERSLPWWDDMRNYIHGKNSLTFNETRWNLLATTNPYEKLDKLQIVSGYMDILHTDGRVILSAKDFKIYISSLESLLKNCSLKPPRNAPGPFLSSPSFSLEILMNWECVSGAPLNHYLHTLPSERELRHKVLDPFRSTSLSLKWHFSLKPFATPFDALGSASGGAILHGTYNSLEKVGTTQFDSPTMNMGAHDLVWVFKWWNMNYNPPHKLRSFSRWPRFGVLRTARSGNLSLDKVMTECFLRLDVAPTCIKHMPLVEDDPANGLAFKMTKLKYELCYSRGKQRYTFECKRDPLDLVYRGLDLHLLKAFLSKDDLTSSQESQSIKSSLQNLPADKTNMERKTFLDNGSEKNSDDGFLLSSDYFTIRRQAPKADPTRLLAWQEAGRKNLEMTYVRSEFENGSESDQTRSDPSDDDGFNVVIADNCQRVFVYGLKLLWTLENRDAVWSWVGGISKAFEPSKPSPSRKYAQRKLTERQVPNGSDAPQDDITKLSSSNSRGASSPSSKHVEAAVSLSNASAKSESSSSTSVGKSVQNDSSEEEGTRHFMVNVIQPQFNLHSEEANGRFLLAAASGRVLARSFNSVLQVGYEVIEQALGTASVNIPESEPEMTWKRVELSVMLEHVQAHVAPTDVDPGAGLQWLPKILRSSLKVKRTGALLERVFMPCQMYFRYTRHKGGTSDLKVKPLKELTFNSPNITATMTSRQFQVMVDVLSNLLFARLPKPRKSSLTYPFEDDDYIEEEADEVVPDGEEEVELAKISLELHDRERKLLLDDIRNLSSHSEPVGDSCPSLEKHGDMWMITCNKTKLVQGLKKDLGNIQKSRKAACSSLRMALQRAAQLRLMEKEKNKSPSYAMRISMRINKVVWSMLADGKTFAEAEISDMIYDFDRDYKDIGVAQFTTKSFVVRNCLPNAKSDMLLSAWNPPPEWGKNFMLRVDAKQGAPKDGASPLELFQVDIYPLKIRLAEAMYRMMWDYFFPEEDQDSQRRQEVWKVSTTAGSKRARKSASVMEAAPFNNRSIREPEALGKQGATTSAFVSGGSSHASASNDSSQASNASKSNTLSGSNHELRRTSSFDRTWEENVAESVANELVMQVRSSSVSTSHNDALALASESQNASIDETLRSKYKDSKAAKSSRAPQEEKKVGKSQDEKRTRARKMMEFHNIKISQVELLVTYEGSRFAVNDLRLLMDTFHRVEFTGTWRRLFSRVKKHIIWGVLKSVTGMQGKKFKDKAQSQRESRGGVPDSDLNLSDSDSGQIGKPDQFPITWLKRPADGAGDGFVTSIKGLFNSQRRRAKAFVMRTMRGDADQEFHGEWSDSEVEFSPFARQLTITKAKKLIRRHTKNLRSRVQKGGGAMQRDLHPSSRERTPYQSDSSGGSSYEEFHD